MKRNVVSLALMAAMQTMQHLPPKLKTVGHKITGNQFGHNKSKSAGRNYRKSSASKYKSHQSDRERTRRLRVYSAAWHSAVNSVKCGHG